MTGNGADSSSTSAALGIGLSCVSSFSSSATDSVPVTSMYQSFGDIKTLGLGLETTLSSGGNLTSTLTSTSGRQSNSDVVSITGVSGQLFRDWLQSTMTQTAHSRPSGQLSTSKPDTITGTLTSNDSDDISKTLSFLLSQQFSQGSQVQQAQLPTGGSNMMQSQFQGIGSFKGADNMNMRTQSSDYSTALTDMLEIGYDNGSRRVISMPNPLGNLSFELPINPPVQQSTMSMPLAGQSYLAKGNIGFRTAAPFKAPQPQSAFVVQNTQGSAALEYPRQLSSTGLLGGGGSTGGLLGICAEPGLGSMPAISASRSFSAAYEVDGGLTGSSDARVSGSSSPEEPISQQLSPQLSAAIRSRTRRRRPPVPARLMGGRLAGEKAYTAAPSPAAMDDTCNGNSTVSTPLLSSSTAGEATSVLVPHRVDRQLAAAGARPLLFVRPSDKESQTRRRKRRCVSSTEVHEYVEGIGGVDTSSLDGKSVGNVQNTQWQRISEQRRRDAMRENFDLLKRMLPQEYMDSDDGRELARPVLLSRFLRWVDDTLIEMENLKTEVARLQLVVSATNINPSSDSTSACPVPWSRSSSDSLPLSCVQQLDQPSGSIG
ncbi:hypothetical protein COEREDRAFT_15013 [Coemansia reversa NRRL 1564]|uniref:BHLH domain-containing protein n=1 Tax=Coemansia reversa (strain ATCC 12441 / NRRL 1564) TaxID=763665 RepID=A0A2G5BCN6_COERN|nr:hypothetical protein COEREDRAFT_15013 [Coemansia reversa NRRL 1564]|eukprot:PIA16784.1 hypothetical protein COEREDRAFT_15013 [Coemansia reversa NRRL 1564]